MIGTSEQSTLMIGFVYILRSLRNNCFYIGSTINVENRLKKHNNGNVISTNKYKPFKLEYFQQYSGITMAKQIEYRLKKLKRKDYIEKIVKNKIIRMKLRP